MSIYRSNTTGDFYIDERKHVARKKHVCCSCNQEIEKGNEYTKTIGTYEGYFVSSAWHTECHSNHQQYLKDQQRKE